MLLLLAGGPINAQEAAPSLLGFELRSLQAPEVHSLERYRGRPLLMVFFQPECTWCLRQFKAINQLSKSCESGFEAVAIGFRGNRRERPGE